MSNAAFAAANQAAPAGSATSLNRQSVVSPYPVSLPDATSAWTRSPIASNGTSGSDGRPSASQARMITIATFCGRSRETLRIASSISPSVGRTPAYLQLAIDFSAAVTPLSEKT